MELNEKMKKWEKEIYQRSILQSYDRIKNKDSAIGVRITTLWNEFCKHNIIEFSEFEQLLNNLIENYIEYIDPQEGISDASEKIIYNRMTGKYFHYIRIKKKLIYAF